MHALKTGRRKNWLITVVLVGVGLIGLALAAYGIWSYWLQYKATHNPNPIISKEVVTHSTETPDETKPEESCASYSVAATQPRIIQIPSLGVEGCIERVGVDQHGSVAVPTNIHVAGWFVDSVLPGEKGLSVIDGHINGNYTSDGIFQHLQDIKQGETVTIKRGDDTNLTYEVVSVKAVPVKEAAETLFAHDNTIDEQLNLITCGGVYDKDIKQFDKRIIVVTKRVS